MIHGIFYRKPSQNRFETSLNLDRIILNPTREKINTWSASNIWFAQSFEKTSPLFKQDNTLQIIAWARLDNREDLIKQFQKTANISDIELILKAYQQYGEACTAHLFGDFCFAIYNSQTNILFCARDPIGVKPFYYYRDEHVFVFSASLSLFHALDCVPVKPSMAWASKFLIANLSMDFEKTAYDKIFKLPPASQLSITQNHFSKTKYFEFHTEKLNLGSSDAYLALYQTHLERAIKTRIQTPYPLGTENSGGLDSATITAFSAKFFNRPLNDLYTFSFATHAEEAQHILSVNQKYDLPNNYISCHSEIHRFELENALYTLGALVEHSDALHHQIFYEFAAKHHIRTLLSGFGGDEFVTTIHADLYLYELLNNKQYRMLYANLFGNPVTRALRFAKLCYNTTASGGKVSTRMQDAFKQRWPDTIVSEHLVNAFAIKETYDTRAKFDHGYANLDEFTLQNRFAAYVPTRLENHTLMAASYGIEYRWPLLDSRLIQCFLSIPSSEKYKKGVGRYLHRKAVSGIVPDNITWKNSKYMGKRVTPRKKSIPLNADLHPDLLPLINLPKLKQQIIRSAPANQPPAPSAARQNVSKVNQLDNWLKYYFPNGCDWADAP